MFDESKKDYVITVKLPNGENETLGLIWFGVNGKSYTKKQFSEISIGSNITFVGNGHDGDIANLAKEGLKINHNYEVER